MRILRCEAEIAYMPLFTAEEATAVAAPEAAKVTSIVCPGIAGSVGQGRVIGAVAVADRDAGIDGSLEARVFGGWPFVAGNGE